MEDNNFTNNSNLNDRDVVSKQVVTSKCKRCLSIIICLAILTVAGFGLGIFGIVNSSSKDSEISSLKAQIAESSVSPQEGQETKLSLADAEALMSKYIEIGPVENFCVLFDELDFDDFDNSTKLKYVAGKVADRDSAEWIHE